jgi:CDP-diglyceride synthetase
MDYTRTIPVLTCGPVKISRDLAERTFSCITLAVVAYTLLQYEVGKAILSIGFFVAASDEMHVAGRLFLRDTYRLVPRDYFSRFLNLVFTILIGLSALYFETFYYIITIGCISFVPFRYTISACFSLTPLYPVDFARMILDIFTIVYPTFLFSHAALFRNLRILCVPLVSYTLVLVHVGEIAAYLSGKIIGGTDIIPFLSPRKTAIGFLGQMIATIALSFTFPMVMRNFTKIRFPFREDHLFLLGALVSIAAITGDLFESFIKRTCRLKDMPGMIRLPGFGGFLDRADGLIFTFPLVFYYTIFNS